MIPQDEWAPGVHVPSAYETFGLTLPMASRPRVHAISLGPAALSAANGSLTSKYWMVSQTQTGDIVIQSTL